MIFQSNDIRGIYGKELTDELAYKIGRATATLLKKDIVVGHDMRLSSPSLCKNLVKGIIDSGKNAILIGLVGTDVLYYATVCLNLPGVMITASHNPAKYNGMKFCKEKAVPISGRTGLMEIKKLVENEKFSEGKGKKIEKDVFKQYVKHALSFVGKIKKMKVVVDAGNGMAGRVFCKVYSKLDLDIVPVEFKLDGRFPSHDPNPIKHKNIHDLEVRVKKEKADLGMAFDGDTDRVAFVDEKGGRVESSVTAALLIKHLLKRKSSIVFNSVCGNIVPETIKKYKGKGYREKVGHTFIKEKMKKVKAVFGCEHSGHFYYKDNYYADSGMISSLLMVELISEDGRKFSEILKEFRKYYKIEETSVKVKDKKKVLKKVEKHYKSKAKKVSKLDGIRMDFDDWWFIVRESNTEPLIRVNLEANSRKLMLEKKKEMLKII